MSRTPETTKIVECATAGTISHTTCMRFLMTMAILIMAQTVAAQEPLVFASDAAHAPFSALDESSEIAGLERDIANAICLTLQRPSVFMHVPWSELAETINRGEADLAFTGLSVATITHLGLEATKPHLQTTSQFAVIAGRPVPDSMETLQEFVVGALWGSPQTLWLEDNLPPEPFQRFPDAEELYLSLHAGTNGIVFSDGLSLYLYFLRSPLGSGALISRLSIPLETDDGGYAFATNVGSKHLTLVFDSIQDLREDGTLACLVKHQLLGY